MAPAMADLSALLSESSFSSTPTDASSSNAASLSSTPPTTVSPDSMSLASEPDMPKLETIAASSIEAAISSLALPETEQHESGQQTPLGRDAIIVADRPLPAEPPSTGRPRRSRSSLPVYNLAKLAGTSHKRQRADQDSLPGKRRRTMSGDALANNGNTNTKDAVGASRTSRVGVAPSDTESTANVSTPKSAPSSKRSAPSTSPAHITRRATRLSGTPVETLATKLSALGKRGKKTLDKGLGRLSRELKRLQDTDEFAHIDTRPVRYTVWSNGKYVDVDPAQEPPQEPPRKKVKTDRDAADAVDAADKVAAAEKQESDAPATKTRRVKKWLDKGLYAGQEAPIDVLKGLTAQERKKLASLPELMPSGKPNRALPMPMYNGLRILINGRDFKLPFDVCNPLPPGQPKPAAYRTMTKNRFVGDAGAYWKKTPHFGDFASKCVCKPEDGCGEDCQNRIMLYECDETNCNVGKEYCTNRAFQDLQERTKKGGRYRVGVEVFKTADRGYGVRSNRCFEAGQIIMEYTGEIITEEECERRMNEVYKDNECYYLMSFDQNMIIDATTGSIARFVNHSCSPNCRMIKWIVSGQPRMALFAGDRPIMTGEELTYDYNFDPFSAKNVQKCLCGSPNCRGVLGPKPKEVKAAKQQQQPQQPAKDAEKKSVKGVKSSVKAGKRKLKDPFAFDSEDDDEAEASTRAIKKRKIDKASTSLKKALSATKSVKGAKKAAKGAISKIKRTVSTVSMGGKKTKTALTITKGAKVKAKVALTTSKGMKGKVKAKASTKVIKRATTTFTTSATLSGKSTSDRKAGAVKTDGRKPIPKLATGSPSRSPSLTIVAAGIGSAGTAEKAGGHPSTPNRTGPMSAELETTTTTAVTKSARKSTPSWKARENVAVINKERKKKEGKGKESEKNEKREKDKENVSAATSAASTPKPAKTTTKIRVITTTAGKRGLGVADR
ncbi:hypothetical protein N656DRAFT_786329 [Canariomyces notabilis]|uniref:Histone-lysine N-methyltransferase ASH1L n=1 Tax=Canariomyces notabilis TaxID=2074819 RepID=A0AAN6TNA3_9PEZI|nr:hypothetical protein N656DRAFT_786329 [Canariomyces arenarius]